MNTRHPSPRLAERLAALALGLALLLLAAAVIVAMHVVSGRLVPGEGAESTSTANEALLLIDGTGPDHA